MFFLEHWSENEILTRAVINRYGTIFAFVAQFNLASSVGIAYTQWLWKTLRKRDVTVSALDKAFTAPEQIASMFNTEMLRKIKLGLLIASIAW
jgi:hypothetical protein